MINIIDFKTELRIFIHSLYFFKKNTYLAIKKKLFLNNLYIYLTKKPTKALKTFLNFLSYLYNQVTFNQFHFLKYNPEVKLNK